MGSENLLKMKFWKAWQVEASKKPTKFKRRWKDIDGARLTHATNFMGSHDIAPNVTKQRQRGPEIDPFFRQNKKVVCNQRHARATCGADDKRNCLTSTLASTTFSDFWSGHNFANSTCQREIRCDKDSKVKRCLVDDILDFYIAHTEYTDWQYTGARINWDNLHLIETKSMTDA